MSPGSASCYGGTIFVENLSLCIKKLFRIDVSIKYIFILFWILTSYILFVVYKKIKISANELNQKYITSFRIGAGIYISTFLFGYNWEYRLIFIIFLLPQMREWLKVKNNIRLFSFITLITLILICWADLWGRLFVQFPTFANLIRESMAWVLFINFTFMLLKTLPEWTKVGYIK
jgi:hypothetical protein